MNEDVNLEAFFREALARRNDYDKQKDMDKQRKKAKE